MVVFFIVDQKKMFGLSILLVISQGHQRTPWQNVSMVCVCMCVWVVWVWGVGMGVG